MRNLQEQIKKAFCYENFFWPFTVWINCSSHLKIFENSRPSASNFKSFSRSLEQFFLTVGQTNFGNKTTLIHLLIFIHVCQKCHICTRVILYKGSMNLPEYLHYFIYAFSEKLPCLKRQNAFLRRIHNCINRIFGEKIVLLYGRWILNLEVVVFPRV